MNTPLTLEKISVLKEQLDHDYHGWPVEFDGQKNTALSLLEHIAGEEHLSPDSTRIMDQLKRSVEDFYNPLLSRGWTFQFAIKDLEKLEVSLVKGESDTSYLRRLKSILS
ncbi:MAG TPA: hypothetical protein VGH19_05330 [Verrucomicrobiae bacterium]